MGKLDERFECGGRMVAKYKVIEDDDGYEMAVPTPEWSAHIARLELARRLDDAGIGGMPKYGLDTYVGADADRNIPKLRKYCDEFEANFSHVNLYLWSTVNGTQKSTCAKDVLARLAAKGIRCAFVLMDDLVHTLMEAERDESAALKVASWRDVPFLVIDECFTRGQVTLFQSGYQKAFVNTFLKYRLETRRLATCFTANVPIDEIGATWGAGMQSLVSRSVPTPMHFDDSLDDSVFRNDDIWGDAK